jgi:hypothetical protein
MRSIWWLLFVRRCGNRKAQARRCRAEVAEFFTRKISVTDPRAKRTSMPKTRIY